MSPSEQTVELQSGRYKIRVLSAGTGDPVVVLHGPSGLIWDPLHDALSEQYHVIAPEHPGSGTSQGLEHLEDMLDLVLYHAELFDVLQLPAPAVIGHSFGGMVAAELAATNPERVSRLALIAPLGLWDDDHPIPDISTVGHGQLARLVLADPGGPAAALLPAPDPLDPEALFRASLTMASVLQFTWPLPDKGLRRRLYRVKAPTLVIWGSDDHYVDPSYGEAFRAAIPGARLQLIDGAGHMPQLEQTAEVAGLLKEFLG